MERYNFRGCIIKNKITGELFKVKEDLIFFADDEATKFDFFDDNNKKDEKLILIERIESNSSIENKKLIISYKDLLEKYEITDKKLFNFFGWKFVTK